MQYKLKPYVLAIRTTERCNVGCFHCSILATPNGCDIPVHMAKRAIQEASDFGIRMVHFSGGEPFLYRHINELLYECKKLMLISEIVTSTYTYPNEDNRHLLNEFKQQGLYSVMVSYDDAHARIVSNDRFFNFVRYSLDIGLYVCVFVTESSKSKINIFSIKKDLEQYGITENQLSICKSIMCYTGRATLLTKIEKDAKINFYDRCPYVIPVPTLTPDGKIFLCPCAVQKAKKFVLGDYPQESLSDIFKKLQDSHVYKLLAKFGPHFCLKKIGFPIEKTPPDICQACELYLQSVDLEDFRINLNKLIEKTDLDNVYVDYEALLSPHKNYLTNILPAYKLT